ncbi:hypothetical protein [Arthrobacter sp. MA-N2]|nr:hypothetical protein [Arthrobacter sp. MA-N2]
MNNGGYRSGWRRKRHRRTRQDLFVLVGVGALFVVAVAVSTIALTH